MSHAESTVEFDPHLTLIVGANDAGKTSLVRALRGVLRVENWPPGGDEAAGVIRQGQRQAVVGVALERDGELVAIGRARGKSKNKLSLTVGDAAIEEYSTVRDVADRVREATGFTECEVDEGRWEDLNFASVDSGRFLLGGMRPDTLLRRVSRLLGGQRIGEALRAVRRELQQAQQGREQAAQAGEAEGVTLERVAQPMQEVQQADESAVGWESELQRRQERRVRLRELAVTHVAQGRVMGVDAAALREGVDAVRGAGRQAQQQSTRAQSLQRALVSLGAVRTLPADLLPVLRRRVEEVVCLMATAQEMWTRRQELAGLMGGLDEARSDTQAVEEEGAALHKKRANLRRRRTTLLKQAGICPLCGREVTECSH